MSPSPAPLNLNDFLATITRGPGGCLCSLAHRGRNGGSGRGCDSAMAKRACRLLLPPPSGRGLSTGSNCWVCCFAFGNLRCSGRAIKRWRLLP